MPCIYLDLPWLCLHSDTMVWHNHSNWCVTGLQNKSIVQGRSADNFTYTRQFHEIVMLLALCAGCVLPGSNLGWDIEYFDLHFLLCVCVCVRPPLWSSGQSFWLQIRRSRVRSPAIPDFLSSSGSGTGSTQPREVKLRSYLNKKK